MLSRRAPLFSVSLAFAIGCLIGLHGWTSLRHALVAWVLIGLVWLVLAAHPRVSLGVFYAFVAAAGLAHTLLLAGSIMPDDLRRLPVDKTFATTQWRGIIVEEPVNEVSTHTARRAMDRTSFVLRMEGWRPTGGRYFSAPVDTPWQPARGDVRCTLYGPAGELRCGDRLEMAMALAPVAPPLCPGELDYRAYEAEQGIYYHAGITALNWRRIETGGGDFWQNLSFRLRDWAYARLQIGLEDDPRMADFLAGMLIGYRRQIPADIEQDFRRTGTLHVFAVSGQNVAELVVVVLILLQLFGFVPWRWGWTVAPIVVLYCLLTGSPASAVRATVMALSVLLAWRLGRPLNALGCWSIALLAMLVWNPAVLLDPGAQLSFGVVLGIILYGPRFGRFFSRPFIRDPFLPNKLLTTAQRWEGKFWRNIGLLLGVGLAATLVSEPIAAIDFHQVTPISMFALLIVIPAAGLITIVGTLAVTFSFISTTWTALLNNANWLFARLLILFVGFLAHEPGASINVPDVRTLAAPLPSFVVAPLQDSACLLVRTSGHAWLFNTGRDVQARSATSHMLQYYGINRLDGLVLAQMSGADNNGAEAIVRAFSPRRLIIPVLRTRSPIEKTMPGTLALAGRPATLWGQGGRLDLAPGISVDILHPAAGDTESHAENRALVLLFHAGGESLLWAGKIGPEVQQELLAAYPRLHADVLVLGVGTAPDPAWLEALRVRYWLQIPPADRRVNMPREAPLAAETFQTWPLDQTGAVEIHFEPAHGAQPPSLTLRPWVSLPAVR